MPHPDELAARLLRRLKAANLDPQEVATFTKADPGTIGKWLSQGTPPRGERLNRLWHLLATIGVESPEFEDISPFARYLGRLLAFGIIDLEKAQEICKLKHPQAIFSIIRGSRTLALHDDKPDMTRDEKLAALLEGLIAEYDVRLVAAESRTKRVFGTVGTVSPVEEASVRVDSPPAVPLPGEHDQHDGPARFQFLLDSARSLGGILPLARYLVSDACSATDRALVRSLLGDEGMFELSNLVNRLCSERANAQGR